MNAENDEQRHMKTPTRYLRMTPWLNERIRVVGRGIRTLSGSPQLRLLFLAILLAPALGAVKPAPRAGADLLERIGSWPGFTRGPVSDVAVADNYAYVAIGEGGLIILDMTEPANPVRVGEYLTRGYTGQVRVVGPRGYLVVDWFNLVILDVSDPTRPRLLGSHRTGTWIESLQVDGERVYLGNGGLCHCQRAFFILDVSNPARPVTLSVDWERGAGRIAVAGEHAYVASWRQNLRVLDVSQPAWPTVLAELETAEPVQGMQAVGDRLYMVAGNWGERHELRIYDTGDPTAPQLLGALEFDREALDFEVVGNYAYVTMGDAGLVAVDVSDPTAPVLAGNWDAPTWLGRIEIAGDCAYGVGGAGLQVIDIRDPGRIARVAEFDTGVTAGALRLSDDRAYLLSSGRRIEVVDVSNPIEPLLLTAYDSARWVQSLDVAGDLAYLGWTHANETGFEIVDFRDPLRQARLSDTTNTPPGGRSSGIRVRVDGHYAYVTTADDENPNPTQPKWRPRLRIFDVSDPAEPVVVSQTDIGEYVAALEVLNDRAYLLFDSKLAVFDVRDPKAPTQLSSVRLPYWGTDGLCVSEDHAYTGGWGGVAIVDLRQPGTPVVRGQYDTLDRVSDLSVNGHYVYAAEGWEGVEVFDVSNAAQPLSIGHSSTLGKAVGIEVAGDYAYVAESGGGLGIFGLARENVTLVEQPGDLTVAAGDTATFTVRAYGEGPLRYQWYPGESGDRSRPVAGANSPTFTTPPLTAAAAYWVQVRAATGRSDSRTARVAIVPPMSVELLSLWPGEARGPSTAGFAVDVAVSGQHAFLADGEGGLRIIDVGDPAQPKSVGVHGRNVRGVAVSGQFVYLVADTLQILDAGDRTRPRQIANLGEWDLQDIFPAGEFAYFLTWGLKALDMRNPAQPQILASDASPGWGQAGMAFVGRYAGLGVGEWGEQNWGSLQILDLSVPGEPRWVGAYYSDAPVLDVAWQGNVACLTLGPRLPGLDVVDMTDVQRPVRMARVFLPLANRVALMGSYACVTGEGLQVFDLGDPHNPVRVGSHRFASEPGSEFFSETRGLQVVGNLAYVAAGEDGLAIYRLTPPLRLNPVVLEGNALRLSWLGGPGIRLQRTASLLPPEWQDVPDSEGVSSLELSLTNRQAFFRLVGQ